MDLDLQQRLPGAAWLFAGFGEAAMFSDRNAKVDVVTTAKTAVLRISAVDKHGVYDAVQLELTLT